jgi:hypothetical protein
MNAYAAGKLYEANKKYFDEKIATLDIALRALRESIKEASEKNFLKDSYYDLEDFRERQEQLIFKVVVDMGPTDISQL